MGNGQVKVLLINVQHAVIVNPKAQKSMLKDIIKDVDCELKYVERYCLNLKAIDYDMSIIIPEQDCTHEKYRKMMENFNVKY